jgi:hypothetical protein
MASPPQEAWTYTPLCQQFIYVDSEFISRWQARPLRAKPLEDNVRLRILLYAGRQASASLFIACPKSPPNRESDGGIAHTAEQAMLYEPFTYWDWHGYNAKGEPLDGRDLFENKRKRRVLWERERPFTAVLGQEHRSVQVAGLSPRERWEGFKKCVEKKPWNSRFVKRIAVANWMGKDDMEW